MTTWIKENLWPLLVVLWVITLLLWALTLLFLPIIKTMDYRVAKDIMEPYVKEAKRLGRLEKRIVQNYTEIKKLGGYK